MVEGVVKNLVWKPMQTYLLNLFPSYQAGRRNACFTSKGTCPPSSKIQSPSWLSLCFPSDSSENTSLNLIELDQMVIANIVGLLGRNENEIIASMPWEWENWLKSCMTVREVKTKTSDVTFSFSQCHWSRSRLEVLF